MGRSAESVNSPNEIIRFQADPSSKASIGITYAHSAVHRDIIARATKVLSAGTGITNILIKAPGPLQPHLEWSIVSGGEVEVKFYEAPTVTAEGDDMTATRLFLPSEKTTQMVAKFGGTVSEKGTLLDEDYNGGAGSGVNVRGGSAVHEDAEWIPKLETWYLIEINRITSSKLKVALEWYEVTEIKP